MSFMMKTCVVSSSYLLSQASSFCHCLPHYPYLPWFPFSVSSTLFSSSFHSSRTASLHSAPVVIFLLQSIFRWRVSERYRETYGLMHTYSLFINRTLTGFSSGIHSGSLHTRISLSSVHVTIRFVRRAIV